MKGLPHGDCPECDRSKGGKRPFRRERVVTDPVPLKRMAYDFTGETKPPSIRSRKLLLVGVCDVSKFVIIRPLQYKAQAPQVLRDVVLSLRAKYGKDMADKVVFEIRTDSEITLRSAEMTNLLRNELKTDHIANIPYGSQQNSTCERATIRTMSDALRTMVSYTDERLWCYAAEHLELVWNRLIPHKFSKLHKAYSGKTCQEVLDEWFVKRHLPLDIDDVYGFGCFCYSHIPEQYEKAGKIQSYWRPGVYLGFDPESQNGHRVGVFVTSHKTGNVEFQVRRTRNVKPREDIMIRDYTTLHPQYQGKITVPYDILDINSVSAEGTAEQVDGSIQTVRLGQREHEKSGITKLEPPKMESLNWNY